MEYGYINEGGYLVSDIIQELKERYTDNQGELKERIISIDEQIIPLIDNGWKPVDKIEESKLICKDPNYVIRLIPFDNGDRISYHYDKIFDKQKIRNQISALKEELAAGDYKIIKCYEANLIGVELPYDVNDLHIERQKIRDNINNLEIQL